MKYLNKEQNLGEAECSQDALKPSELLYTKIAEIEAQLTDPELDSATRTKLLLDAGYIQLDLKREAQAWRSAEEAFALALPAQAWEAAVQATDIMAQCEHPNTVAAIAHGIWLGVTYPIDPELSVAMLQHLIEQTPDSSDGAAVAAAVAGYIVSVRAEGKKREDLLFFTAQMLGNVARRHSQVEEQELFDFWVERMQLDDMGKNLERLAKILDIMVGDAWWYDRDALRARIPE